MLRVVVALVLVLSAAGLALADAPEVRWIRLLEDSYCSWGWYVHEMPDHGYVIASEICDPNYPGTREISVIKLNEDGSDDWSSTIGTDSTEDVCRSVKATTDGGCIVAGNRTGDFGAEGTNYFLLKYDEHGDTLWSRNYDFDSATDYGFDVCQLLGGGYMMIGNTYHWSELQEEYDWNVGIMRISSTGDLVNDTLVDIPGSQHFSRVMPTLDSGAIAVGTASSIMAVKIDKNGHITWRKGYGGVGTGISIVQLADSGYAAFGNRTFSSPNYRDFWLVRLNPAGDTLWTRRYPHGSDDLGYGLDKTSDGGFIMCGEQYRNEGMDPTDVYLIRVDAEGDTLWTKVIGEDRYERSYCVQQTYDGGYIISGRTDSYSEGTNAMIYVIRLEPDEPTDVPTTDDDLPADFSLKANYPNPFNPSTTIEYSLDHRALVNLEVFNVLGQKVRTLVDETKSAGSYRIEWDGSDNAGNRVASGLYLYRLSADGEMQSKKMLMLK